jgi:hypothetical protein
MVKLQQLLTPPQLAALHQAPHLLGQVLVQVVLGLAQVPLVPVQEIVDQVADQEADLEVGQKVALVPDQVVS